MELDIPTKNNKLIFLSVLSFFVNLIILTFIILVTFVFNWQIRGAGMEDGFLSSIYILLFVIALCLFIELFSFWRFSNEKDKLKYRILNIIGITFGICSILLSFLTSIQLEGLH